MLIALVGGLVGYYVGLEQAFQAALTAVLVYVTACYVYLSYESLMHINKPIITTKVISSEEGVDDTPEVLESGTLYVVISNVSKNQANNLKIGCELWLGNERLAHVNKPLRYLNPGEATKELVPIGEIVKNHPYLFEEIEKGRVTKKIPKKTLMLSLKITVIYGFQWQRRHKILDSYKIELGSLQNYPRFEDHPLTSCWNMRDDLYIYKLSEGSRSSD